MLRVTLKLMALFALCSFVIGSDCGGCPGKEPAGLEEDPADPYSLSPLTLSLDTAFVPWSNAEGQVALQNLSTESLEFSGFAGNCPEEISWAPAARTVSPGTTVTVDLTFEPQHHFARTSCQLTPEIKAGGVNIPVAQEKTLTVEYAAGEAACQLSPGDTLKFGAVEAGGYGDGTLTIKNTTTDPSEDARFTYTFSSLSGQCDLFSWGYVHDSTGSLGPGEEWSIPFKFEPNATGDFQCEKVLATVGRPKSCPSPVIFRGTGLPGPEPVCEIKPGANIQYGDVNVGSSKDLTFTISNRTTAEIPSNQFQFLLDTPVGDCDQFTIDPADGVGIIGPGGAKEISKEINVRFTPEGPGAFQCTRTLSSLKEPPDPSNPYISSPCPTQITWGGTGVVPTVQWSVCRPEITADWRGIFTLSENEVYLVGDGGSVFESAGDCQWAQVGTIPGDVADVNLTGIWGYSDGTETSVWAVGNVPPEPGFYQETGAILRWDGIDWTKIDEDGFHTYATVWGSGFNDVYFAGTGIATDFPNAKHWEGTALTTLQISDMGMSKVSGMSGTGSDNVWAVLEQNFNSVFQFQGSQWENKTPPFITEPLNDVWVIPTTLVPTVYAVGDHGGIYRYAGSTWTDESIPSETRDFHAVWASPTGQLFVVGQDRALYRGQLGNPTVWTAMTPPDGTPPGDFLDVWGSSDDDVYVVGTEGVVIRLVPGG